ncbi:TPA: hypothetical protein QDZ23_000096 [Pseudomonas putida]|nr:hypothetical protein [Pseudomonas putida]
MSYDFKGNNAALASSIHALLALDAKGALATHGIGEMARQLLEASASRLTEQHQGYPVALPARLPQRLPQGRNLPRGYAEAWNACLGEVEKLGSLYTHADTGEVEALRGAYLRAGEREHELRTELATWKRRAIEAESKLRTYDPQVVELGEEAMQALLAEPKPKELVLTKCKLCDQLQADLTARDERIDTLTDDLDQAQYDKDAWKNHEESLWVQVFHGEGDDPFISAVSGAICIEQLTLIQEDIVTGAEDMFEKGPGFYVLRCCHYEAHYDNVGMTEPAHWELAFESYERFPWADEAEAMVREAKEAELVDIDELFEVPDCCFCCDTGHIIIDDTQPEFITTPCTECEKGKQIEATAISPGTQVAALMESRGES